MVNGTNFCENLSKSKIVIDKTKINNNVANSDLLSILSNRFTEVITTQTARIIMVLIKKNVGIYKLRFATKTCSSGTVGKSFDPNITNPHRQAKIIPTIPNA